MTERQASHICTCMPTYEYGCSACGHQWEEVQRITAAPTELCPKCAKSAAHRLISAGTNFILKGGGWYSDLYASPKSGGTKDEAKPTGGDDKTTPATKTESGTSSESTPKDKPAAAAPATSSTPSTPSSGTT